MRKASVLLMLMLLFVSCGSRISVPSGEKLIFKDDLKKATIEVKGQLEKEIRSKLASKPDTAKRNVAVGLSTRAHLKIGDKIFMVRKNTVILADDWGVRTWEIPGIETKLTSLLDDPKTATEEDAE